MRVVVVGGSIAALTAVQTLRAEGFDGAIAMLSDEERPPYTRVPLSKDHLAGRGGVETLGLDAPVDVDLRLRVRATGLDVARREVLTVVGPVPYDGLVIATGARARPLDDAALTLRDHGDAARLRAALDAARTVLVVGGGFLGMEVASTCLELGKEVTVIDPVPPLDRLLGAYVAARVRASASDRGLQLVVGSDWRKLAAQADVVVAAVGDLPNSEWLAGSGLRTVAGAVVVDECGRVPDAPDVVAAGDVVAVEHPDGRRTRLPTWTNAVEQARTSVLALLQGAAVAPHRPSHYSWTSQFGLDLKLVGRLGPVGPPDLVEPAAEGDGQLLSWGSGTVVALNHPVRPALLKRMLEGRAVG